MIRLMKTTERAQLFAALGDPIRLAIVEELMVSDAAPRELAIRHSLPTNLLSHHLAVLEEARVISRSVSSGDRRRRYLSLRRETLGHLRLEPSVPLGPVLFVCTHNSARSQLAAALWQSIVRGPAGSAGTEPAATIHPGTVDVAKRAGLDLPATQPRHLDDVDVDPELVITVCDQAHEQIGDSMRHWHWSTPDPVTKPTARSFDTALERLRSRIVALTGEEL